MAYDFDTLINRRNTNSLKWNVGDNELPMWVADMDFRTAPEIIDAIQRRVADGVFGYTVVSDEWYESIQGWWYKRHQFKIEKDWLMFCTGVIPAISSIIRKMTTVGENILVQTPVYNNFFTSIKNNGRYVVENRLRYDGNEYNIDFEDLEEKLKDPQTTMMILCNPHNPIGKLWDKDTLCQIGTLCKKNHVIVISDEIHCDLTQPGFKYVPFASVSDICNEISITCISPSKTFNLAGIQTAAVVVPDEVLRQKVRKAFNTDEIAEPNVFAIEATKVAYTKGEAWLDELRHYLLKNKQFVKRYLAREIPILSIVPSHATYLLWMDCHKLLGSSTLLCGFIREKGGLYLSDGNEYKNGEGFLRMNIACPKEQIEEGVERLRNSILHYNEWANKQC